MSVSEETVRHCQELVASNSATYLPNRAASLSNDAMRLAEADLRTRR
ncbi:hypothetical protein OG496_31070 [Streptomyces sp. NBC_00988]|nr:hypothetical protein OG496_31070 [Streptomyces sp. NBC_00988]